MKRIGKINNKEIVITRNSNLVTAQQYLANKDSCNISLYERRTRKAPLTAVNLNALTKGPKRKVGEIDGENIVGGNTDFIDYTELVIEDGVIHRKAKTQKRGGHEYVDLGLPSGTLWARCNLGAEKPEEFGNYFAWGEYILKTNYKWSTYKYCSGSLSTLTKYNYDSSCGTTDYKRTLESSDDAATVIWGEEWCMPSAVLITELLNSAYTTTTFTSLNGVKGALITSKINNLTLFLPSAGYYLNKTLYTGFGGYASCTLGDSSPIYNYNINFGNLNIICGYTARFYGLSVRPVCK